MNFAISWSVVRLIQHLQHYSWPYRDQIVLARRRRLDPATLSSLRFHGMTRADEKMCNETFALTDTPRTFASISGW